MNYQSNKDAALYQSIMCDIKFYREKIMSEFTMKLNNITNEVDPPSQKRVDDEVKILIDNLPTTFNGSILIRQNSKFPRIFSALMIGVEGTPYDNACILFDIYLPDKYPKIPLKINCTTSSTYGKFNPSISINGDISMSLLGTFGYYGNNDLGKWNPKESSIYQILFSIQSLLFTEEPYFNDSSKEHLRNTTWGKNESKKYNQQAHLIVIAEGIYKVLKNPPPEFSNAIKCHFLIKRDNIKKVFNKWKLMVDTEIYEKNVYMSTEYLSYEEKTLAEWVKITNELLDSIENDITDEFKDIINSSINKVEEFAQFEQHTSYMEEYETDPLLGYV